MSLTDIKTKIARAEADAGRPAGSVTLIAVSKVQPLDRVKAVLDEGHRVFGENRVQEAQGKWPAWKEQYGGVDLHLIGPLQTNKARAAVELFDHIHSLDRPKLAQTLARLAQERGCCPAVYVQVNTGEEPQKAAVMPADVDDDEFGLLLGCFLHERGRNRMILGCIRPCNQRDISSPDVGKDIGHGARPNRLHESGH